VNAHREVKAVARADANVGKVAASVARAVANAARPIPLAQRVKMASAQLMLVTTWPAKTVKPHRGLTPRQSAANAAHATDMDATGVNVRLNNVQTMTRARLHLCPMTQYLCRQKTPTLQTTRRHVLILNVQLPLRQPHKRPQRSRQPPLPVFGPGIPRLQLVMTQPRHLRPVVICQLLHLWQRTLPPLLRHPLQRQWRLHPQACLRFKLSNYLWMH
jgi:hypothetical protein